MAPKNVRDDSSSDGDFDPSATSGPMQKYFDAHYSTTFMSKLPEKIRQRAEVLMKYHDDYSKLHREMEQREVALRKRYDALYAPLYQRRKEIVTGTGAPVSEEEVAEGFPEEHKDKVSVATVAGAGEDVKGLPNFWLKALQHHMVLNSLIQDYDEDLLSHLVDISSHVVDGEYGSFDVTFTFAPNDFINEEEITLVVAVDGENTKIVRSPFTWKAGKDITKHTVVAKRRNKRTGKTETQSRVESRPSFFSLFTDEEEDKDEEDEDDSEEDHITLLQLLHNRIVPCAVNYYTGEAPDGSSDVEEDDEEYDEEDEDDD